MTQVGDKSGRDGTEASHDDCIPVTMPDGTVRMCKTQDEAIAAMTEALKLIEGDNAFSVVTLRTYRG